MRESLYDSEKAHMFTHLHASQIIPCVVLAIANLTGSASSADVPRGKEMLAPMDAGARYGQALGASRACYGLRATDAARALEHSYQGKDAQAFRTAADKTAAAWQEALSCKKSGGPNECRLIFEM